MKLLHSLPQFLTFHAFYISFTPSISLSDCDIFRMSGLATAVLQTIVQSARDLRRIWVSKISEDRPTPPDTFYVPAEITRDIFRACLPPEDPVDNLSSEEEMSYTPVFSRNSKWTPFELAQVCRDWRSNAFETRELWQSIVIIGPKRCHLHRARLWIANVGPHPIDIVLEQTSDSDEEREVTGELMTLFAQRLTSWRKVSFTFFGPKPLIPSNLLVQSIAAIARERDPKLRDALFNFNLQSHAHPERWEVSSLIEIFHSLQNISSLVALRWSAAFTPGLKFSRNLVFLDLDSPISMVDLIENLVRSPQLQSLLARNVTQTIVPIHNAVMHQGDDMDVDMENVPRVVLPALQQLSIIFKQVNPVPFFDRVSLPSLTVLELLGLGPQQLYLVRQLLQVSECTLDGFGFFLNTPMTQEQVIDWLQLEEIQLVRRLSIYAEITDDIVNMLHRPALYGTKADTGETYFPNLTTLKLGFVKQGIDDGNVLRMLGSRFWAPIDRPEWPELSNAKVHGFPEDINTARLRGYKQRLKGAKVKGSRRRDKELKLVTWAL
ncbi:hypothetical protein M413DRAFT_423542 [Hebeloma cylindrosporum]|uniref:Uncharacterized protein n=1 Tax=Hebeloma cylindrosporum TaxID=76867 RepID=A0A0C2Y8G5_HEBCY|nr:hypothetical protein M413DRAFT_423542 [Hebeloma cylindrosporum h7]